MVAGNCALTLLHRGVSLLVTVKVQIALLQVGMAAPNFTGDGQQKTIEALFCSPDLSAGLYGNLTFFSVLNSFLSASLSFNN